RRRHGVHAGRHAGVVEALEEVAQRHERLGEGLEEVHVLLEGRHVEAGGEDLGELAGGVAGGEDERAALVAELVELLPLLWREVVEEREGVLHGRERVVEGGALGGRELGRDTVLHGYSGEWNCLYRHGRGNRYNLGRQF